MPKRAQLADGRVLEFPDDTPGDVIDRVAQAETANPQNDSRFSGFMGGLVKPVDNLAELATQIPVIGPAIDQAGQALGMPSNAQAVANNEAMRRNNSRTGFQAIGNMAGTLPTAALPGGLLTQGAVSGGLLSDSKDMGGVLTDAATGGAFSKLGGLLMGGVANTISPQVPRSLRKLAEAGVTMTPGQMLSASRGLLGRQLSRSEEALTSIPFVGDAITMAREAGSESLQRALANRSLGNIGASVPRRVPAGTQTTDYLTQRLSREYDRLVPNLSLRFDNDFVAGLGNAVASLRTVPAKVQRQFQGMLDDVFTNRASGPGMAGRPLKDAETRLTELIKRYSTSADGDQRALGDALRMTRQTLRDGIVKSNPQFGEQLQALNKGWAQARVMRMAGDAAADGVPSPQRLWQETRRAGVRDPLVRSAAARLRNNTPDSGTGRRGMAALGTTAAVSGGLGALVTPALAVPMLGAAAYTRPVMQAVNKAVFAPRGPVAQGTSKAIREARNFLAPLLAPFAISPSNK